MELDSLRISRPEDLEPLGRLLTALDIGITVVDTTMRVFYANDVMRHFSNELLSLGRTHCYSSLWSRSDRCPDCMALAAFRTKVPREGIRERARMDGPAELYRVRAIPLYDDRGEVAWVAEVFVRLQVLERAPERPAPVAEPQATPLVAEPLGFVQLRDQVRAQEKLLAHITREAADAIVGVDLEGRITSWNRGAEQVFGYLASEVLGAPLARLAGDGAALDLLERVQREDALRGLHMEWTDAEGQQLPVDVSAALLRSSAGVGGVALVARDLTSRERLERQLMRSEKLAALGSLAAGLAHEIGTPLNVISATAEYLMPDVPEGERGRLEGIIAETDRISRLVRELLTFARTSRGRSTIALGEAVERVVRLVRIPMEKKHVTIDLQLAPELPALDADPDGVHQLLLNLLLNAVNAVRAGGHIAVRVRTVGPSKRPPTIVLEVHDDGPGVPEALRERIFDPFFTTRPDGTGLGLSVCAQVVSAHGGDIRVTKSPLGGACFAVQLPVTTAQEVTA